MAGREFVAARPDAGQLRSRLIELKAALANNGPDNPFRHCLDLVAQIARETGSFLERNYPSEPFNSAGPSPTWHNPFLLAICTVDEHTFIDLKIFAPDGGLLTGHSAEAPLTFTDDSLWMGENLLHSARTACDRWLAALAEPAGSRLPTTDDAITRLLRLYTGNVADERIHRAAAVMESNGTVDDKLESLDRAMKIPATASAQQLADALGVSKTAIIKSKWWQENRAGKHAEEVEERGKRLKEKGQHLERPNDDE